MVVDSIASWWLILASSWLTSVTTSVHHHWATIKPICYRFFPDFLRRPNQLCGTQRPCFGGVIWVLAALEVEKWKKCHTGSHDSVPPRQKEFHKYRHLLPFRGEGKQTLWKELLFNYSVCLCWMMVGNDASEWLATIMANDGGQYCFIMLEEISRRPGKEIDTEASVQPCENLSWARLV